MSKNLPKKPKQIKKPIVLKINLPLLLLFVILAIFMFKDYGKHEDKEITYTEFINSIHAQPSNIKKADFDDHGFTVKLTLNNNQSQYVKLTKNDNANQYVLQELAKANIPTKITTAQGAKWTSFLINFAPILLSIAFLIVLMRNISGGVGGGISFLKNKSKLFDKEDSRIKFEDVAGIDEAKQELEEVVEFLKNPQKFKKLGAKIPKGVLLVGPPGTGKTLLAKAIAGEAKVPFYSGSGSDFVEMFAGLGASRVRDLFEQARKNSPCIVFLDEIDAIGRQRGIGFSGGHDEREQTLNQMLVEMDGFEENDSNVIVLAATNRPDVLDKALTRPGRFDRQVNIDPPDAKGREQILKVHAKGKTISEEVDLSILAKRTPGFTGAQLANMMNEAALIAAQRNKSLIENEDFDDAVDKVWMGVRRFFDVPFKELEITAYHETGHALMALLDQKMPLHKVTIIPRSMAMGVTWSLDKEDHTHWTKSSLINRIKVAFGGKVAEELVFGDTTAGVIADLEQATNIAKKMVTKFGMSDLGPISLGADSERYYGSSGYGQEFSQDMGQKVDAEILKLLNKYYAETKEYLENHQDLLEAVSKELLIRETLDSDEVKLIVSQVQDNKYDMSSINEKIEELKIKLNNNKN